MHASLYVLFLAIPPWSPLKEHLLWSFDKHLMGYLPRFYIMLCFINILFAFALTPLASSSRRNVLSCQLSASAPGLSRARYGIVLAAASTLQRPTLPVGLMSLDEIGFW
jgi:hypothetical protein